MCTGCLEDCPQRLHMPKTAVTVDNGIIYIDSKSLQLCTESKMQNLHFEEMTETEKYTDVQVDLEVVVLRAV